jgi:16S rRNA (adenine1518-N6/adenine1519-N6)-dimethyltransferase
MPIDNLPPLREVIAAHGLQAKKQLGQNFLLDLNLTARIARVAGPLAGVTVIEIGPGPGGLTRALLAEGAQKVIAIERDDRALPALAQIGEAYPGRLEVISGDALEIDYAKLTAGPVRIVANLPYNIATPLLTGWLTTEPWPPFFESLTLMFQREVAERIVAKPGDKAFGRLGVLCGWRSEAKIAFNVDRNAFTPPPNVTSTVVHLKPKPANDGVAVRDLEAVTRAAFGQRRKMIRQSLRATGMPLAEMLEATGLRGDERAEDLPVKAFLTMARELQHQQRLAAAVGAAITSDYGELDRRIIAAATEQWKKQGRLLTEVRTEDGPDLYLISARIHALVKAGILEAQGDLRLWRFSDVRRSVPMESD